MPQVAYGHHASAAWLNTLAKIVAEGRDAAPRGKLTRELPHHTVEVYMADPLVLCPERNLSVRFACAEALWILAGDTRVEPLAAYAPRMREFSDDGVTLAGAYGPGVVAQLGYVVSKLLEDRDTRQAVLTLWKPNPPPSKDIPCTLALTFAIRAGRLHCHAFMRSSDAWLGLPYDVFSFSMVAAHVACEFNARVEPGPRSVPDLDPRVELGRLYLTAASSHLYETNREGGARCLAAGFAPSGYPVPADAVREGRWAELAATLERTRDTGVALWGDPS